jgi:hypothetical protein
LYDFFLKADELDLSSGIPQLLERQPPAELGCAWTTKNPQAFIHAGFLGIAKEPLLWSITLNHYCPVCVDHAQLRARGWTPSLIERFLHRYDEWGPVDHWANFRGKPWYHLDRVILAESTLEFQAAYDASTKRRKFSTAALAAVNEVRSRGKDEHDEWLKTSKILK